MKKAYLAVLACCCVFPSLLFAEVMVEAELIDVKKIWDNAPHSAFTDLIDFDGKLYCSFRQGDGHVCNDGNICVMVSKDSAETWTVTAVVKMEGWDLRDADFSIAPDGRLMLLGGACRRTVSHHTGTFVSFSEDGNTWTEPKIVVQPGRWLWRVTWHKGKAYGFSYSAGDQWSGRIDLMSSSDGIDFDVLVENVCRQGSPNEVQMQFDDDGTAIALLRRAGASALLGKSSGDFTEWKFNDLNRSTMWNEPYDQGESFHSFGGPNFIQTFDGIWVGGGRLHKGGDYTALTYIDVASGTMEEILRLPSGGDTSYPGFVWKDNILYMSYYSSHEDKTSIYLARIKLTPIKKNFAWVATDAGIGSYEAFPDVCRLQDGRLMCVFYAGNGHVTYASEQLPYRGRISYCISHDDGFTWTQPETLYDGPGDDRDPSITQLPDGRLACVFFSGGMPGVWMVVSDDAGNSWSKPQKIAADDYQVSSPIRVLSHGRYILGLYESTPVPAVIFSDDEGVKWSEPINLDKMPGQSLSETDIIELDDGTLYLTQRTDDHVNGKMHWAVSKDNGSAWSGSKPFDFWGQCQYLHKADNGIILMAYRGGTWSHTCLRYSVDQCNTWSDEILVDPRNGAQPSMVNLKDGSVLITYYDDIGIGHPKEGSIHYGYRNDSNIRARRFSVTSDGVKWLPIDRKSERLRERAVSVLRKNLLEQTQWVRVHAAEALLWHGYPQGVKEIFLPRVETTLPKHRIGVWRVLAQATEGKQRQKYIDRIEKAFLDLDGPDRGHAVETLMKLGYKKRPAALMQMSKDKNDPLAPYASGALANSGRAADESNLADLLESPVTDHRLIGAYSLRYLDKITPATLSELKTAALKEAEDSPARVYLYCTWFIYAEPKDKLTAGRTLVEYAKAGDKGEKYEACNGLGRSDNPADVSVLISMLGDLEPDVNVSAAEALLRIIEK
jgi:HEAT repeat protein